jgi:glycosyltransferase involved in cell wall biosynthesis
VVPNAIAVDGYGPRGPADDDFTVVFTATFGYPPNAAASRRLLTGIFPALKQRIPSARLALVGREPTEEMQAAAEQDERVEVTGPIDHVAAHLRRASAMAVPLSEGHGTRFKVLEAFATGTPVVSSAKGIQGIDADPGEHYLLAETDAEFVDGLVALARDPALAARLAERGLELVRGRYSLATVSERVTAALADS